MAVFSYKAMDVDRSAVAGMVTADTPRQARDLLRQRGLMVQQVKNRLAAGTPAPGTAPGISGGFASIIHWRHQRSRKRHDSKMVDFIRELSTLLAVGIPLLETIDTVLKQHRGSFRAALLQLRDDVASGVSLADAMRRQPGVFDDLCAHIAEVGENAGTLEKVMDDLADFKDKSRQLRGRIGSALLYPAIVLVTGAAVTIFLMTFVTPNLIEALTDANRPLPAITKVVKSTSDFLVHRWWLLLAIMTIGVLVFSAAVSAPRGKRVWHALLLRMPVLGDLIRKQAVVRVAIVIATLMRSGIVFIKAVEIAQQSTSNVILRAALERCRVAVGAGQDIAKALEHTRAFPPTVLQIFAVGQQSGRLEDMLERLALDYDRQVATAAGRLTSVLEPILILLLAVIVGAVAFATILPILEAGNVL